MTDISSEFPADPAKLSSIIIERFKAVLFDMDGVLTDTAGLHALAWKQVFDEMLAEHHAGQTWRPFDPVQDYRRYVDGRAREDGVRAFLDTRGIRMSEGNREPGSGEVSVAAIARRKDAVFTALLAERGVTVCPDSSRGRHWLREQGVQTAVVSASHHCAEIIQAARMTAFFDVRIDGQLIDTLSLRGKPAPDMFLEAARRLSVPPARAVVVEDAVAGVRAGRAGEFGLVIGVARDGDSAALREAGAHVVVSNLREFLP
jgi:beta-phosphoglucomutase family hydrolase